MLLHVSVSAAPRPLSQLQRVHGCVWAALQDGTGISEGADRDRPADPEKVRTKQTLFIFCSFCVFGFHVESNQLTWVLHRWRETCSALCALSQVEQNKSPRQLNMIWMRSSESRKSQLLASTKFSRQIQGRSSTHNKCLTEQLIWYLENMMESACSTKITAAFTHPVFTLDLHPVVHCVCPALHCTKGYCCLCNNKNQVSTICFKKTKLLEFRKQMIYSLPRTHWEWRASGGLPLIHLLCDQWKKRSDSLHGQ